VDRTGFDATVEVDAPYYGPHVGQIGCETPVEVDVPCCEPHVGQIGCETPVEVDTPCGQNVGRNRKQNCLANLNCFAYSN
jgi:hypothetical protein